MSPHNSASHFTLPRTQACFPRPIVFFCLGDGISLTASAYRGIRSNANSADRNVTHNLVHSCYPFCSEMSSLNCNHSFCSFQLCKAQIVHILFVVFSSDVIISSYPLKMSPQNSASHFRLTLTQACFPHQIVLFCLGGGISRTASAYQEIRSNANSTDRHTRPCRTTVSYL